MSEPFFTKEKLDKINFMESLGSSLEKIMKVPIVTHESRERLKEITKILSYFSIGLPIVFIDESNGDILEHSESVEDITFGQIMSISYFYEPSSILTDKIGSVKFYKLYCKHIEKANG